MDVKLIFEEQVKQKYRFQYSLKAEQIDIIERVLNKKNVMAVLRTGFGKSDCFLIPPLICDELQLGEESQRKISVVISPLKSLMKDQVNRCQEIGIKAVQIMPKGDMDMEVLQEVRRGEYSVVFMSPEILGSPLWRNMMCSDVYRKNCILVCLDEAHCIVDWGREDFRIAYREVHAVQSWLDNSPILLLTATMTPSLKQSTLTAVGIEEYDIDIVAMLSDRPNIFIDIHSRPGLKAETELAWLAQELREKKEQCRKTLVYCKTINMVARIAAFLSIEARDGAYVSKERTVRNRRIAVYHSEVPEEYQKYYLEEFGKPDSKVRVLVATVAFGMGVNIPDVEVVIHWGVPKSILSYWQEVGRCARDGRDGNAIFYEVRVTKNHQPKSDKGMLSFCSKLEQGEHCARALIMEELHLPQMGEADLKALKDAEQCGQLCENCTCKMCKCCSICKLKCNCLTDNEHSID